MTGTCAKVRPYIGAEKCQRISSLTILARSASVSAPSKLPSDPPHPELHASSDRIPRHNHPRSLVRSGEGEAATARPPPREAVALSSATLAEGFLFGSTFFLAR